MRASRATSPLLPVLLAVPLVWSCADDRPPPAALEPLELPDTSRLDPSVRAAVEHAFEQAMAAAESETLTAAERGTAMGELGRHALTAELHELAEAALLNATRLDADAFAWPYYLGHLYRGRGDTSRAIEQLERALGREPDEVPALAWLGRTLLETGEIDRAESLFERVLELQPESAIALYHLGKIALERGDHALAAGRVEAALERAPGASIMHYTLALAYRGLGRLEDAERQLALRGETEIHPHDPWMDALRGTGTARGALERGSRLYVDGRLDEAERVYREALASAPENAPLNVNLGSTLMRLERHDEALRAYEAALELDPTSARAAYGAGAVHERLGNDATARELYGRALELEPGFPPAHLRLGHLARRRGAFAESVEHYRAVLAVDAQLPEARFGEAIGLVGAGRYAEARTRLEQAVVELPEQPAFAHALARVLVAAPDASVRDAGRAFELLDRLQRVQANTDLAETIAMALAERGQFDEALRWQTQAIEVVRAGGDTALADAMRDNAALYRRRRACRTPWRAGHPVFLPGRHAEPAPIMRRESE